jgi:hypothetical protein
MTETTPNPLNNVSRLMSDADQEPGNHDPGTPGKNASAPEQQYISAGTNNCRLSPLFLRENRVSLVPISLRNGFLALAPAVRYGVSNLAALCL